MQGVEGEYELTPNEIATLFALKNWPYATRTLGYGVPDPDKIHQLFVEMTEHVLKDGRPGVLTRRGRFLAMRHEDTNSVDLYLNVGYVWPEGLVEDEDVWFEEEGE
jgi:hypothetical protein